MAEGARVERAAIGKDVCTCQRNMVSFAARSLKVGAKRMEMRVEPFGVAVIGTGGCGGIGPKALSHRPRVKKLHGREDCPNPLKVVPALTSPTPMVKPESTCTAMECYLDLSAERNLPANIPLTIQTLAGIADMIEAQRAPSPQGAP